MAYISTEDVRAKRKEIVKNFPNKKGWRFSVTCDRHTSINVIVREAPFNMLIDKTKDYEQVNHFWIKEHYKDYPEIMDVLLKIKEILADGQRIVVNDADYGEVPNFYINMAVGSWERPFKVNKR